MMTDWKKLQNGSDIRGVAVEGVNGEEVNLSVEVAGRLARAFVAWLRRRSGEVASDAAGAGGATAAAGADRLTVAAGADGATAAGVDRPTAAGVDGASGATVGSGRMNIAVGMDSRISGPALKEAVLRGIREAGADASDCGLASTPAMFMITIDPIRPCSAGIMITASHLPFNRNGFKFFTPDGGLEKTQIAEILEIAAAAEAADEGRSGASLNSVGPIGLSAVRSASLGRLEVRDFMSEYSAYLVDYIRCGFKGADCGITAIAARETAHGAVTSARPGEGPAPVDGSAATLGAAPAAASPGTARLTSFSVPDPSAPNAAEALTVPEKPLAGMHIIVDAGNGAGGFFATKVLQPLGADISGSQFLEPDGMFPNHVPNPENASAMESICRAVKRTGADLGIIFDTDVDRSAIVDKTGNPINRNALIALISSIILREHPGSTIVTDSVTSDGLADFIKARGGVHHRFKRGYKNVINESKRLNEEGGESWIGIETSGHCALRENHYLDDGAFLVAKLLVEAAKLNATANSVSAPASPTPTAAPALGSPASAPVPTAASAPECAHPSKFGETLGAKEQNSVARPVASECGRGSRRDLASLIADLRQPLESSEIRFKIMADDFAAYGKEVLEHVLSAAPQFAGMSLAKPNYEGVRVNCSSADERGWFLIRMSLHDPVLPLNIESEVAGGVARIKGRIMRLLEPFDKLSI